MREVFEHGYYILVGKPSVSFIVELGPALDANIGDEQADLLE